MIFAVQCRLWKKRFSLKFRRDKFFADTSFIDVVDSVLPVLQPSSKPKTKTVSPSDFSIDENWLIHWMNWRFSWSSRNSYDSIVVKGSKNVDFEQIFLKGSTDFETLSAITPSKFQVHLIEFRNVITDSKAIKMPDFWKSVCPPRTRKSNPSSLSVSRGCPTFVNMSDFRYGQLSILSTFLTSEQTHPRKQNLLRSKAENELENSFYCARRPFKKIRTIHFKVGTSAERRLSLHDWIFIASQLTFQKFKELGVLTNLVSG